MKNTSHRPRFTAPASSFVAPAASSFVAHASSSVAPASSGAPATATQMETDVNDPKVWSDFVTKVFIDIMVDEVTNGNMPNGVFHTRTWSSMMYKLNSITKRTLQAYQLKAKMHRLRAMYREFYSLKQNTGFGWNSETNTVTATEEVWKNYLKVITRTYTEKSDDSTSDASDDEFLDFVLSGIVYDYHRKYFDKSKVLTSSLSGREFVAEVLNGSGTSCFDLFRMKKDCFLNFCNELRSKNYLSDSRDVLVEEKVATFLFIIGHNVRHRVASNRFQHSTETISRNFKEVLRAVCRLGKELIKQESMELPDRIKTNPKYYPWFKNCIGAIDGTQISAWAPAEKQISCRGRKATITQNVMCACDFNMIFTYVYSGWEGSAHDSKVFLDAITNPNAGFPWPPKGSFYLVDSGYPCMGGFLPPYRGERYHAQEYRGQGGQPKNPEELFNYRHSSLRMTIERCFGVLKNRFPILKLMPSYKPSRQRLIVTACCAIHNYIRKWNLPDELFRVWEEMDDIDLEAVNEVPNLEGMSSNVENLTRLSDEGAAEMAMDRNHLGDRMWVHRHN